LIETRSIEIATIGTEEVFGVPLPVKDSDNIEVYTGLVKNKEFDARREKLNSTAITQISSEIYQIDLGHFMQIITGPNFKQYQRYLLTMLSDSSYRTAFLHN
jgi:hypothetical protein